MAISPPFERWSPSRGGNPLIPALQARTTKNAYQAHRGLHEDVDLGTRVVKIKGPWPGQGVAWPAFPRLWDDYLAPFIKPRLSVAINNWSPIAHRGASISSGQLAFQKNGHPPFAPPGAGLMDPVEAGRGYSQAVFNPDIYPVQPAGVPLVKQPGVVTSNRRGGQGYVLPNPFANTQYPFYIQQNLPG